ncbi:hypothetical protein PF003_g21242 [Phytophthora fragariae]|nr:hypothetical protein PF003_g21242 [Phytophthora fragariae]
MVIALHPDGPQSHMHLPSQLQYQDRTAACRYLGLQVGSKLAASTAWKKATEKLDVRLRLASQKTLTVDQCSLIAGAIIVPNLLYIARHEWPSASDVNDMDARIRHYVWHGQFKTDVSGLRAWLDADLAALPRSTGGLAIPDIRAELYALTAVTVSK